MSELKPIFIFAQAPRTGSTWLQRILTSTGKVLIWGEATVLLFPYGDLWSFDEGDNPRNPCNDLKLFRKQKADMWMAVLQPFHSDIMPAYKEMLEKAYGASAKREGFARWGMKETRWNEDVLTFVNWAWPECEKVYIIRDFEKGFCSRFKANKTVQGVSRKADILEYCNLWAVQGQLILDHLKDPHTTLVHHKDLLGHPNRQKDLCRSLGLGLPDLSQSNTRISWSNHVRKFELNWDKGNQYSELRRKKTRAIAEEAREDLKILEASPHYKQLQGVSAAFGYKWLGETP